MTFFASVRFSEGERRIALALLASHLRRMPTCDPDLEDTAAAYGRLLLGDDMTAQERNALLPKSWYISQTGKYLSHKYGLGIPITPRRYAEVTRQSIVARGMAVRGQQ